jgi:Family of unknown function (DUF6263)
MRPQTVWLWLALGLLVTGCNQQKPVADEETPMDVPDWLSSESEPSEADPTAEASRGSSDLMGQTSEFTDPDHIEQTSSESFDTTHQAGREPRGELKLQLQPEEQFPLTKQVITTLVQTASDGTQQTIQSELNLLMAIRVEEVTDGRTRLGVLYKRVIFEQTMDGQKLVYNSVHPPAQIPVAAQAYHDMVNNGFSFWIGKDNQINEPVGFQEFLAGCLKNVPPALQKQVLLNMEAGTGENGISDFVDNTIGLLPFGQDVTPGQVWTRPRTIGRPIPMVVQCTYTLQELTPAEAVVKITGDIIPSQTINKAVHTQQDDVNVTVLGGSTMGQCTIFRDTGLPKESFTERVVNMTVELGNGLVFDQRKTVVTRVEAFPAVRP